jgi:hypothetical protein
LCFTHDYDAKQLQLSANRISHLACPDRSWIIAMSLEVVGNIFPLRDDLSDGVL